MKKARGLKLMISSLLSIVLLTSCFTSYASTPELIEEDISLGNLSIQVMEEEIINENHQVKLFLDLDVGIDKSNIKYEIIDNNNMKKIEESQLIDLISDESSMEFVFNDINHGDEILISNIPSNTSAVFNIIPYDEKSEVNYLPSNQVVIEENTTKVVGTILSEIEEMTEVNNKAFIDGKYTTTDTFESVVGSYTLKNILTKYNIFSFNDISAKHIVGPIVAKEKAFGTRIYEQESGSLIASDYSNGTPSYVGKIERFKNTNEAHVKFNYYFDWIKNSQFVRPNFYINEKDNDLYRETEWSQILMKDNNDNSTYVAPNNAGYSPVLQNDNFVNFQKAKSSILTESQNLLNNSKNIEVTVDTQGGSSKYQIESDTGYLKIDAGKNYIIKDASRLRAVDIQYPQGYHPVTNPYPYNTIINISGTELVSSGMEFKSKKLSNGVIITSEETFGTIESKKHFYFPSIFINGEGFSGNYQGENGEYGSGNSVVWNMPNIKTVGDEYRMSRETDTDILGHIIAPNAQFWNYKETDGNISWNGGNNNGCAIVDSWHGGKMESHMWSYGEGEVGDNTAPSYLNFRGKKNLEGGDIKEHQFTFILDLIKGDKEGIESPSLPKEVSSNKDGSIEFSDIKFTKAGEYIFNIKEKIPDENDDIKYDLSEYEAYVVVNKNTTNNELEASYTIKKVKDSNGNNIETGQVSDEIVFNNKIEEKILSFTIKKIDELTENILPGAVFDLYEGDANGNPIGEIKIKDITTKEDGTVVVENNILKEDTLYVLVETKAPEGYEKGENIVFYIKGTEGLYEGVKDKIVIEDKGVITVTNKQFDEMLPETGEDGNSKFIIVGIVMMLSSVVMYLSLKNKIRKFN